jgi:cytochrome c-type biogenesis protein CcmE
VSVAGTAEEGPATTSADGDAGLAPPGQVFSGKGPRRPRTHWRLRFLVAGAVILGAIAFLLYQGLTNSIQYFLTANQAVAQRARLGSQVFRLEGTVVPGTVHQVPGGVDFSLSSGPVKVAVSEHGSPPELFRAGIPVVLVGHFQGQGYWSNQIMVKHSATYIAQHPNRVRASDGSVR